MVGNHVPREVVGSNLLISVHITDLVSISKQFSQPIFTIHEFVICYDQINFSKQIAEKLWCEKLFKNLALSRSQNCGHLFLELSLEKFIFQFLQRDFLVLRLRPFLLKIGNKYITNTSQLVIIDSLFF